MPEGDLLAVERLVTIEEYFLSLQDVPPERRSFESVVVAICEVLKLLARAAVSKVSTGDWKLANLGIRMEDGVAVRLLDFACNQQSVTEAAYSCVKKAWSSFLESVVCLGSLRRPPQYQKEWSPIFTRLQVYLGKTWWPKGPFPKGSSGVPSAGDVSDLQETLLGLSCQDLPTVPVLAEIAHLAHEAQAASAPGAEDPPPPPPPGQPDKDALFAWLHAQGIAPGEGTWISHLCSPGATPAFPIPAPMAGSGVEKRVRQWLETLADVVEVYQDATCDARPWSFKARPPSSTDTQVTAPPPETTWLQQVQESDRKRRHTTDLAPARFTNGEVEEFARIQEVSATPCDGVASEFQKFVQSDCRTTKTGKAIGDRIQDGDLSFDPTSFLPDVGDDYGLLFRLLLHNMPLHRVRLFWSDRHQVLKQPANMSPQRFHHDYIKKWKLALGDTPSLCELRAFAHDFLTKKCPPSKVAAAQSNPEKHYNDFKWNGFYMDCDEIDKAAKVAVYQYGLARMGHALED